MLLVCDRTVLIMTIYESNGFADEVPSENHSLASLKFNHFCGFSQITPGTRSICFYLDKVDSHVHGRRNVYESHKTLTEFTQWKEKFVSKFNLLITKTGSNPLTRYFSFAVPSLISVHNCAKTICLFRALFLKSLPDPNLFELTIYYSFALLFKCLRNVPLLFRDQLCI